MRMQASNRVLVTISVMLAAIMQTLDTTIANVALPYIQSSLSATQDQITWVLTSYIVAAAIMMLPTGILSARFGRKKYFAWSILGFTITSILCGTSVTLTEIVIFRMLQGVFGAALVPLSQTILLDSYPKEQHGVAMAIWGIGIMVGPILGPTLGGYLTEYYSWHWVFFINLPFGIMAFLGVMVSVSEVKEDSKQKFNVTGFMLVVTAVGALQLMLDRGELKGWFSSNEIVIELIVAILGFYFFIIHLLTSTNPFISPKLFVNRNFVISLIAITVIGVVLYATLALIISFLQNLRNFPVLTTGYIVAPRGVGTMLAMMLVARIITKYDPRHIVIFGMILLTYSMWEMTQFSLDTSVSILISSGMIQGAGFGFVFVPLSTIAFSEISSAQRAEASSLYNLIRNIGGSIGISISTNILSQKSQVMHAILSEYITPFNPILRSTLMPKAWNINNIDTLAAFDAQINLQAQSVAFINDFIFIMWLCVFSVPLLFLLKKVEMKGKADVHVAAD